MEAYMSSFGSKNAWFCVKELRVARLIFLRIFKMHVHPNNSKT